MSIFISILLVIYISTVEGNCPEDDKEMITQDSVMITGDNNSTHNIKAIPTPNTTAEDAAQCILVMKDCKTWYNIGARDSRIYYINPDDGEPYQTYCHMGTDEQKDCQSWYQLGLRISGIYTVNPDDGIPFQVYCNMETDGGGWTVFQRRIDGSVDFYRNWKDYKDGFGNLTGEFWLGLEKIYRLTKDGDKELRIDLGDFEDNYAYAKYSSFSIGDSTTYYTLSVSGYSGDAGDTLLSHWEKASGSKFTTKDGDNDAWRSGNCATSYSGAWWYYSCHGSNLNGLYLRGKHTSYADGVEWTTWTGYYYSLRYTEMKLK